MNAEDIMTRDPVTVNERATIGEAWRLLAEGSIRHLPVVDGDTLRGGKHWDANAWSAAARWELRNGDVNTAATYADHALDLGTSVTTLRTKAAVLEKKGDAKGAAELRDRAKSIAGEWEAIGITVGGLMNAKKYDDTIAYLNGYVTAHPSTNQLWRIYAATGDAYTAKGDAAKAKEYYDKAMAAAHDTAERTEVWDSINSAAADAK